MAENRWISTGEALPEKHRPVIICRPYDGRSAKVEQGSLELGGWWRVYGTRVKKVTHWMPMPEPPEEAHDE